MIKQILCVILYAVSLVQASEQKWPKTRTKYFLGSPPVGAFFINRAPEDNPFAMDTIIVDEETLLLPISLYEKHDTNPEDLNGVQPVTRQKTITFASQDHPDNHRFEEQDARLRSRLELRAKLKAEKINQQFSGLILKYGIGLPATQLRKIQEEEVKLVYEILKKDINFQDLILRNKQRDVNMQKRAIQIYILQDRQILPRHYILCDLIEQLHNLSIEDKDFL